MPDEQERHEKRISIKFSAFLNVLFLLSFFRFFSLNYEKEFLG